jgi:urease accessory protein UreH
VDLAEDAWFLGVEMLVFGRLAMGENVERAWLRDLIRVRRGGRLLWHDAIRLDGEVAVTLRRKAVANGARTVATILYVAPEAERTLDAVRGALEDIHLSRLELVKESIPGESLGAADSFLMPGRGSEQLRSRRRATPILFGRLVQRRNTYDQLIHSLLAGEQRASGEGRAPTLKRDANESAAIESAASTWNGLLIARILAPGSEALRVAVVAVLRVLRGDRSLPRVWMC